MSYWIITFLKLKLVHTSIEYKPNALHKSQVIEQLKIIWNKNHNKQIWQIIIKVNMKIRRSSNLKVIMIVNI